jgi:predicted DNA-binding transcriptional regulator YafY
MKKKEEIGTGAGTTGRSRQKRYLKSSQRLAKILARLYAGEVLSMRELAEEFDTSLRTIQRDVNERLAEFPIRKEGERFFVDIGQIDRNLDPEEVAVLELLDEMSRKQGSAFYTRAHPLLARLRQSAANPFYAKLDMEDIGPRLHEAVMIERAIKESRVVRCRYRMEEGSFTIEIHPLKIANFEGYWYVIARDARSERVKKYLLRKISEVEILDEGFERSEALEEQIRNAANVWFEPANEPTEVRLFIDGEVARYFRLKPIAPSQTIIGEDADGSIEVLLRITHPMEIVPIVKYWLPHIRILEPLELEERIREEIGEYLSKGRR